MSPSLSARTAFQYRDFRLYQGARFLSILGTQVQSVAVGWQVYDITHRALDLGLVGLVQFVPFLIFSLIGGHAADRYDRRQILVICYALQVVSAGVLLATVLMRIHDVRLIYLALAVFGFARAFSAPAQQALLPHLVPTEIFGTAVAWGSSVRQVAVIAGPALGGVLYEWLGPASAYGLAGGASFLAVIWIALMEVRTGRMDTAEVSWDTFIAGIRFVWAKKVLLGSISLDLFAVFLGGAVALLPIFARDILHTGPWGLGMLRSAPAVGAALMATVLANRPFQRRAGVTMLGCVAGFGVATVVFGISRNFALSLACLFAMGAFDMVSVVVRLTLEQIATPPEMRGRVGAVNMMFIGASNELGEFESGVAAAWLGTVPSVVVGGIGTLLVVALWSWWFPELRRVQRLDTA